MMLSDTVHIARRFQRSIRVDSDISLSALEGFICPPSASMAVINMAAQVRESGQGAFTWTGPYGCGKSSLAVALGALLGSPGSLRDQARRALGADTADQVSSLLGVTEAGWRVLPVVGRRADPEIVIAEALDEMDWAPRRRGKAGGDIVARLTQCADRSGADGLLVIIDEMGKFLEHATAGDGDVYLFQRLAEAASRSGRRLIVIGVLHRAFDDYASRLSREGQDEWIKIQGRFTDVPINVAGEEQIELIASAIQAASRPDENIAQAETVAAAVRANRPGTSAALAGRLHQCWPLHPIVACLLGPLSRRRFGQNQRSVFGFLNSAEPKGFQEYLRTTPASDASPPYGAVELWDYLRANLEPAILASPDGHRWSLAVDAVERCEARGGDSDHIAVVKTIALIDLFKERSGLLPSCAVLSQALPRLSADRLDAVLEELRIWSAVIFRKHLDAFAIYAGSDFDIDVAVAAAKSKMTGLDLGRLRSLAMLQPIMAKRHHHETGALRWFDVDLVAADAAGERVRTYRPKNGASGLFLLIIGSGGEKELTVKKCWRKASVEAREWPVAVGWTRYGSSIREVASELIALETVRSTSPELNGDAVARREVSARIARSAAELEDLLRRAFTDAEWIWKRDDAGAEQGSERSAAGRSLSVIASDLADRRYSVSPRLHNELLNRIKPSSNAVAAQKELLKAMLMRWPEERLGFEQWPAAAGMYASLLERTGLHVCDPGAQDRWRFVIPAEGDAAGLHRLWQVADALFQDAGNQGADLAALYKLWSAPPFGVRDGLLPVLAIAYYMSRMERLAVYLDKEFQAKRQPMLIDRLLQEPDSVRLRWTETTEFHARVLSGVADLVASLGGIEYGSDQPTTFDVARGLVAIVVSQKPWVQKTAQLSPQATKVRNIAKMANDPNKLMLDDLPSVLLGAETADQDPETFIALLRDGLVEIVEAFPKLLRRLEAAMLRELRVRKQGDEALAELRLRATTVKNLNGNLRFDAFATRLAGYTGQEDEIEGIVSLAASKSARDWSDRDIDNAMVEIAMLAREFIKAESLAHLKGRSDQRLSMAIFISDPDRPSPVTPDFDISVSQKQQMEQLVEKLAMVIEGVGADRNLALAAVAELGARLAEANLDPEPPLPLGLPELSAAGRGGETH